MTKLQETLSSILPRLKSEGIIFTVVGDYALQKYVSDLKITEDLNLYVLNDHIQYISRRLEPLLKDLIKEERIDSYSLNIKECLSVGKLTVVEDGVDCSMSIKPFYNKHIPYVNWKGAVHYENNNSLVSSRLVTLWQSKDFILSSAKDLVDLYLLITNISHLQFGQINGILKGYDIDLSRVSTFEALYKEGSKELTHSVLDYATSGERYDFCGVGCDLPERILDSVYTLVVFLRKALAILYGKEHKLIYEVLSENI